MDSGERVMHSVAMITISPRKEYWPSRGSNQPSPVLNSCKLQFGILASASAGSLNVAKQKHRVMIERETMAEGAPYQELIVLDQPEYLKWYCLGPVNVESLVT